jgi:hypothetical protein
LLDPAGIDVVRGVVRDLGLKVLTLQTIAGDCAGNPETDSHRTALVDLLNKLNFMFRARDNRRRCINGCIAAITWFDKNSVASIDFGNV